MTEQTVITSAILLALAGVVYYAWHNREPAFAGVPVDLYSGNSVAVPTRNSSPLGLPILASIAADLGISVPLGASVHNWGNLRFIANPAKRWNGQLDEPYQGFGQYPSDELGCRAMGHQIMSLHNGGNVSVESILNVWAPKTENDTNAYIDKVCQDLQVLWNEPLGLPRRLGELMASMIEVEQGYNPFSIETLATWGNEA